MLKKELIELENFIVIAIIIVILGLDIFYIVREKKKDRKCIGCPSSGSCGSEKCNCSSSKK